MPGYYSTIYVSLEIGKNVNWLAAYGGYELTPIIEPLAVRSDKAGFEQVSGLIDELLRSGQTERLVLGHEPTGVYHEAWARALAERYEGYRQPGVRPSLEYRFINPLVSKRKRESSGAGRKRKTDKIDLKAIALCLRDGQGQAAFLPGEAELRFQLWGSRSRQLHQKHSQVRVLVLAQLDRLWPGLLVNLKRFEQMHPSLPVPVPLVLSKPLERGRVRAIIRHCPNPHDFMALGAVGIQALLRQHLGRCGPATAQRAYQIVAQAVLPPKPIAALLAQQLQSDFERYLAGETRLQELADQAADLVPGSPAAVLTTIPGVSPLLAARYLAYLGHPQRFERAAQVWAFAGFDPITEESGDFRRLGHISRKGQPGLRDTLFLIGLHTAKHVPAIAAAKERALKHGKGFVGATLHAAHKANRLCHHLLYHQSPFDPARSR